MRKYQWSQETQERHKQKMLHRHRHNLNIVEREELYLLNKKYGVLPIPNAIAKAEGRAL